MRGAAHPTAPAGTGRAAVTGGAVLAGKSSHARWESSLRIIAKLRLTRHGQGSRR